MAAVSFFAKKKTLEGTRGNKQKKFSVQPKTAPKTI
jgi:hypothetical protein